MKTYIFKIGLEPDAEGWRAFYSAWESIGASTWGVTQEDALKNIQEVLSMILEESDAEGRVLPAAEHLTVSEGALVAVSV
ncbi:MAG: hypothetical protein EXR54_08415 [Dehalococcoidia bacterium]|nr:hypothetical protein [Dehalococcoidia bacterium]MSQ17563.1 hypothetical protein [Dehalococcoidia bacterium]